MRCDIEIYFPYQKSILRYSYIASNNSVLIPLKVSQVKVSQQDRLPAAIGYF